MDQGQQGLYHKLSLQTEKQDESLKSNSHEISHSRVVFSLVVTMVGGGRHKTCPFSQEESQPLRLGQERKSIWSIVLWEAM